MARSASAGGVWGEIRCAVADRGADVAGRTGLCARRFAQDLTRMSRLAHISDSADVLE